MRIFYSLLAVSQKVSRWAQFPGNTFVHAGHYGQSLKSRNKGFNVNANSVSVPLHTPELVRRVMSKSI